MDRWLIIPSFKYLVHMQECDSEECTIDYSIYKYENLKQIKDIVADEDFQYEPYDGGWYTIDNADILEALETAPNCVIDEFVDYICETQDTDEDTPDYHMITCDDGGTR